jgi:DNA-binding protein YbaB
MENISQLEAIELDRINEKPLYEDKEMLSETISRARQRAAKELEEEKLTNQ